MIWKFTKKYILLVSLLGTVLVVYQNCSRSTSFQTYSSAEPAQSIPPGQLQASPENKSYVKSIGAAESLNGQVDIYLLIDDTKSNAVNANQIVEGIKDLFVRLSAPNQFEVKIQAYSMSQNIKLNYKSTYAFSSGSGRMEPISSTSYLRISEHLRGIPIAEIRLSSLEPRTETESKLDAGLLAIKKHLAIAVADASSDTNPLPFCDIVGLLGENKTASVKKSSVFILIADEDTHKDGINNECVKHWDIVYQRGSGGSPYVMVSGVKTVTAEGGGTTQLSETVQLQAISSCSQESAIRSKLISRGYSSTYSNCHVYRNSEGGDRQVAVTYFSMLEEPIKATEQSLNPNFLKVNPQLFRAFELPMQGPVFIGLFAIQNQNDIKNPDQEIATNLSSWIPTVLPVGQFQLQSLTKPNYTSFIDQVMNFKANADNNLVSIEDLIGQIPKGKSLKISEVFFNDFKIKSYSRQGNSIIVNDSTIKISNGGLLKIIYSVE